jgi:glyoxylase-like metal-dependent hydrolase (beta-lactamase superfamily II)
VAAPNGGLAHRASVAHGERFERKLWKVRDDVWCMVGNGLSNQTFIEGPEGLIAIDTGECVEEMQYALNAVAEQTNAQVTEVIYTHFHYVGGTAAVPGAGSSVPIWSHAGVVGNRERNGSEVGPVARSGLIHQFGITLPDGGPDALVNVGLGTSFRNAEHRPFTEGFIEPTNTFTEPTQATIAGLRVEFTPAPSDADDSVNIWFPDLEVCVNNIVWPVLFNVFAIRGEEYRDPRVLLRGLDHVASLGAEHLVGPTARHCRAVPRSLSKSSAAAMRFGSCGIRLCAGSTRALSRANSPSSFSCLANTPRRTSKPSSTALSSITSARSTLAYVASLTAMRPTSSRYRHGIVPRK